MTSKTGFGVNVWWTVPEVIKDSVTVQTALAKHGFDTNDIPLPSRRTEVSRAAYSFQNRLGKSNRRVTEKANDNINFVTYGILDREQETSDTVGFSQNTTIRLDKSTNEVKVEGSLSNEVMEAVRTYTGKITDDDIRYFLRKIIRRSFGIAKRPTGGIYFVPDQFANAIKEAQAVLDDLGTGAKLYVEGVVNGVQERANVWASVEENIEGQLVETLSAVDRIEKRANAIKDHEEKLTGVKKLMEVYIGLLGEEAKYQSIAEKIEAAVKTVSEKMSVMQGVVSQKGKTQKIVGVIPAEQPLKKAAMPPPPKADGQFRTDSIRIAYEVFKEAGTPLNYREAAKRMLLKGFASDTSDKYQTDVVWGLLKNSITKGDGLFQKVGRGIFTVA